MCGTHSVVGSTHTLWQAMANSLELIAFDESSDLPSVQTMKVRRKPSGKKEQVMTLFPKEAILCFPKLEQS